MGATANRAIHWVEQGFVPDSVIRSGIRRLVKQRLAEIGDGDATQAALSDAFAAQIGVAVVAPMPEKANEQHYEIPAAFFPKVLGAHRKYSACWWPAGVASLNAAEAAALARLRHSGARLPAPHLRRLRARHAGRVQLQAASSTYRIAMGPRAGRKVLSLQNTSSVGWVKPITTNLTHLTKLCVNAQGFSLHAGVRCDANDRQGIEQLCRYITRPAISNERLSVNREGNVVLKLKTAYRNGTTHIVLTPMEFMQRLAALVPRPRLHLIRFHGVLAPNAKLRSKVVPVPAQKTTTGEGDCQHAHSAPVRMTWARLLKRVFDIERCACGGKLKLVAVIEEPAVIEKILTHLGLSP